MSAFGDRLESLRNGMTQKEFAASLQTPINTYTNWVRGIREPSMSAIINLCTRLGVSSDWLLGIGDGQPPRPAASIPSPTAGANCNTCKYKRLAEALKAVQAD